MASLTPWTAAPPSFLVLHHLPELVKFMPIESVMPSTISFSVIPFSSRLQYFPGSGSIPINQFFTSAGKSIGASASESVTPMNIQD